MILSTQTKYIYNKYKEISTYPCAMIMRDVPDVLAGGVGARVAACVRHEVRLRHLILLLVLHHMLHHCCVAAGRKSGHLKIFLG